MTSMDGYDGNPDGWVYWTTSEWGSEEKWLTRDAWNKAYYDACGNK